MHIIMTDDHKLLQRGDALWPAGDLQGLARDRIRRAQAKNRMSIDAIGLQRVE
jgi:hypothetical protein